MRYLLNGLLAHLTAFEVFDCVDEGGIETVSHH